MQRVMFIEVEQKPYSPSLTSTYLRAVADYPTVTKESCLKALQLV